MHENEVINLLDQELNEQAKIMVPRVKFGCIVSGGIDSSLQAAIISKYKSAELYLAVNHLGKDPIMSSIKKFNSYFPKKIQILEMNPKKYKLLASECYTKVSSPLHTHDLPSRLLLSRYFRKKNCKVFFSADGCDELFGGQQVYEKIFFKNYDFKKNQSPYSSIVNFDLKPKKKDFILDNYLKKKWTQTYKKYEFVESLRDRNILSTLYNDYFIQSINVANRSNDLVCCDSSVEPRNIFIQKKILKLIINLPLKYKINFECKNKNISQKYILKKLFSKYLSSKLILPKSGFSGFPDVLNLDKKKTYSKVKNLLKLEKNKNYYNFEQKNQRRDLNWKIANTEMFLNEFN
jgi:asparagine synthase (glutamine-hydrolysing)